jgi:hypothetical protein
MKTESNLGHILMICPACEEMHEIEVRSSSIQNYPTFHALMDIYGYCPNTDKKFHIDDYYFD